MCGVLALALLAGCGAPAGTDGDLTDDWQPLPPVRQFVPAAGVCYPVLDKVAYLASYTALDCARTHRSETVYIGKFPAAYASAKTAPAVDADALRSAFPECDAKAQQFLGGNWRGARMSIAVVPPSTQAWAGGSRWYRCEVFLLDALDSSSDEEHPVDNTGSLRGVLSKPSPLAYGCFNEDEFKALRSVDCRSSHRFEYVGVFNTREASLDRLDKNPDAVYGACYFVIAHYVRLPDPLAAVERFGVTFRSPSGEAWARGDRGVRCFLWSDEKALTRSLKGAGPSLK